MIEAWQRYCYMLSAAMASTPIEDEIDAWRAAFCVMLAEALR